jgi:hypothetical protein
MFLSRSLILDILPKDQTPPSEPKTDAGDGRPGGDKDSAGVKNVLEDAKAVQEAPEFDFANFGM